jgi:hypothetical protein
LWKWDTATHRIALEASTGYTKIPHFPNAAERIAKMPASFKFIYVMRNPLERIESHYGHGQIAGWVTTEFDWNKQEISDDLINFSSYAKQISEYYKIFPPDSIKLILFEDFVKDTADTLRDVCEFLGVTSSYQFRKADRRYNRSRDRVANPVLHKLKRSKTISRIRPMLPYGLKRGVKSVLNRTTAKTYTLSPEARAKTFERLRPDLKRLRDDYGVDIETWGLDV